MGRGPTVCSAASAPIFSPVQSVADGALKPARDLVNWFDQTFDARGRNSRLHDELQVARKQSVGASAALAENAQLRKLLQLDRGGAIPSGYEPVTGRVIARSPTVWFADVTIDVGSDEGVKVNDPVVNGDGLVGTVSAVTGGSAQVTLIADHSSAVSAKVVPLAVQGVIRPNVGDPGDLILDFIDSTKHVHKGQAVVTAGWRVAGNRIALPAQHPDRRSDARPRSVEQEASQQVHVRPYADLRDLDLVQVLTGGSRAK